MPGPSPIAVTVDTRRVARAVEAFQADFERNVGIARFRRAAQWAMDEATKAAVLSIRRSLGQVIEDPSAWTMRAFVYRRATAGELKSVERGNEEPYSEFRVLPRQSVYLKYLFGAETNTRLPGDAGLARTEILIPFWDNIKLTQGVSRDRYGNVPTGFMARLNREANEGKRAKRRNARGDKWGVYKGEITLQGEKVQAYVARPPKVPDPENRVRKNFFVDGRGRTRQTINMVSVDRPRILFLAVARARYRPILQKPWLEAQEVGIASIAPTMGAQLAENIAYAARRGR